MEIQIPVADQDTATESQPTDRTGYQTISDNWSREGHISTSALTSRSHALSSVSQPTVCLTTETDSENDDTSKDKDDTRVAVCGDGDALDSEHPRSGGDDDTVKNDNESEKSYTPAHSATEEVADENLLVPDSSPGSDHQVGVDGEETEVLDQTPQETTATEQQENSAEPEETVAEACDSDVQETQNGDAESLFDQTGEDEKENTNDGEKPESEREGKVFLTENDNEEEGSDISDVRAETPDWAEEEEGKEGGSVSDEGEVTQKQDCISMNSQVRPLTRSTLHEDIAPGQRAVVNTPVSYYTANETVRNIESRLHYPGKNTSHAGIESAREAAFQRAMTLMSSRCESKQEKEGEGGLFGVDDSSYGYKYPQYFYVQQRKPAPMPPLKAWKGYHGNVYFEPIQIARVSGGSGGKGEVLETRNPPPSAMSGKSSGSRRRVLTGTTRSQAVVPVNSATEKDSMSRGDTLSPTRSTTRLTFRRGPTSAKSAASSRSIAAMSQQHVLYLDKQAVTQPENSAMQEELLVMEKQQATGSLNIQPRGHFPHDFKSRGESEKGRTVMKRSGASSAKFDRICRGSVANKLRRAKSGGALGNSMLRGNPVPSQQTPLHRALESTELMVVGDKFAASSLMSPLLRTQTQFSLSNQRMTVNSPDLYGAFDRLPPLQQVRISLRHMDAHGDDGFGNRVSSPYSAGTSVGATEELKPFIKYSPDVKAQFNQQIKYY